MKDISTRGIEAEAGTLSPEAALESHMPASPQGDGLEAVARAEDRTRELQDEITAGSNDVESAAQRMRELQSSLGMANVSGESASERHLAELAKNLEAEEASLLAAERDYLDVPEGEGKNSEAAKERFEQTLQYVEDVREGAVEELEEARRQENEEFIEESINYYLHGSNGFASVLKESENREQVEKLLALKVRKVIEKHSENWVKTGKGMEWDYYINLDYRTSSYEIPGKGEKVFITSMQTSMIRAGGRGERRRVFKAGEAQLLERDDRSELEHERAEGDAEEAQRKE